MENLARRLGVADAVVIGLSAMLGAGVFVAFAPAASLAGGGVALLAALAVAGVIAWCNASSSAVLAARYPESGGTYVYGRERLGPFWGFLAGWGFVIGKTASCAAMGLTIGSYLWPQQARWVALIAVVALTAVNLRGVTKTALAARIFLAVTLLVLAGVLAAGAKGLADPVPLTTGGTLTGVLGAAGLLFFAFAGYARVATLGEEVRDPARTIPRAVAIALAIVLVLYAALATLALLVLGADRLAASKAPLADVVTTVGWTWLAPVVRVGAGIAVVGVLLSLLAGIGRTALAMARRGDLPRPLAAVHPVRRVPHVAELVVGVVVAALVLVADLRGVIGFSSFAVLVYYAVANASAWTLGGVRTRVVAALGLVGCLAVAASLPWRSVTAGLVLFAVGAAVYWGKALISRSRSSSSL